ncbi:hypothetical protein [Marinilabilia rubra]|uniref:Uncharacterized protein n=1 Tax=Marinilabilia rubra TaxID=2162893 RepID=A0A2U2B3T1_9BACT|nr:hypothetical protein [Marinilabilia rubra]PWD97723.1 hypothetical protein DDZ16_19410 [Marinilabilia rubra]
MSKIQKEWATEKLKKLRSVSVNYSIQEKEKIKFIYLRNLLEKLPKLEIDKDDILIKEIAVLIDKLPPYNFEELDYKSYLSKFNDLEYLVKKRLNLIPHNKHNIKSIDTFSIERIVGYIFIGIIVSFSILFFKRTILIIALAVPLSIVVSKMIDIYLYKKAKKDNRVI